MDISQPYDPEKVLERAIRIKKFKPMIGWVCFYRVKPNRFKRYLNEGLKFCINKKYPILEISYAKHSSAPSGVLIHGVRAEIKHIDGLSQNNRPTIVAAIEEDNLSSIRFAEKIGFEYLGSTVYETEAEYEEEYPYIKISVFMYILNWEKFYFKK